MPHKRKIERILIDFPPAVCRLLARTGRNEGRRRPLTDKEIAEAGQLLEPEVIYLSEFTSWDIIPIYYLIPFTKGCRILINDSKDMSKHYRYLRCKSKYQHLKKSKQWSKRWLPMIIKLNDNKCSKKDTSLPRDRSLL